jgi:hypothetical protein
VTNNDFLTFPKTAAYDQEVPETALTGTKKAGHAATWPASWFAFANRHR